MIARTALAAAALLALTACNAKPDAAPAANAAAAATTPTHPTQLTCANAPQDVVGEALQLRLNHSRQSIDANGVTCTYDGGGAEVRLIAGANAESFAQRRRRHAGVVDVPGFHDEAYRATTTSGEVVWTVLVAREDAVEISVSSGANTDQARRLVSTLFDRL